MGIYYRSLWTEELSMGETVYFGLSLLAFYAITYGRGVRSFLSKRIVYFNFVPRSHAKINPVWHDIYVYSNSNNECSSCCCDVTSVDEKYWSDEDTSRIILAILYCISIFVGVINEIYSCTCGETMATMDYKNVIFSISLSFWIEFVSYL